MAQSLLQLAALITAASFLLSLFFKFSGFFFKLYVIIILKCATMRQKLFRAMRLPVQEPSTR